MTSSTATCPTGCRTRKRSRCGNPIPTRYIAESMRTMADHVRSMLELQSRGATTFDYGNNIRGQAIAAGVDNALDIIGFVPEYIRPLFCEGSGPFRWVALSGDPDGHRPHRRRCPRDLSRQRALGAMDPPRSREGPLSRASVAHLLAVVRRAREDGPRVQRSRRQR